MLELLTPAEMIISSLILIFAYIIRGITGFGSGLIAIPLLAVILPISIAVPLVGFLDYASSLAHGLKLRSDIHWKLILPLLPFTLIGLLLALYIFNTLDALLLKKYLGSFIIAYASYTLFTLKPHSHNSRLWAIPSGLFGGLVGTLFGTGGPFYVIYLQLQGLGKTTFRATVATIFFLDGSSRIVAYSFSGFYNNQTMLLIALSFPIMIIGMMIGGRIHTNISHQSIQKGIGILLLFSGTALLL